MKGEKGTNLSIKYGIGRQQISDIRKNKEKIMKFADNLETSKGLKLKSLKVAHDEQLDKALCAWFKCCFMINQFCSLLIFILFSDYPVPRLSGLFRLVPTSLDNRGSTAVIVRRKLIVKKNFD